MARPPQNSGSSRKPGSSFSKRKPTLFSSQSSRNGKKSNPNAIGFAKRQERKEKNKEKNDYTDVYEYDVGKNKRSNVALDLDREEAKGFGDMDADEDNELIERIRKRMGDDADAEVGSDEDEEIESDDAFEGESDEERFAAFHFQKKRKQKTANKPSKAGPSTSKSVRFQGEVDLREDEEDVNNSLEEQEHDDEDESENEQPSGSMMDAEPGAEDDSGSEEESGDDEEEDEDEDENPLASEDEEEDEDGDALSKLDDFIGTLETKKRKASELGSVSEQNVRKRRLTERTELGNEGEFSAPIGSEDGKLRIEDLLTSLTDNGGPSSSLTALKKSAKLLSSKGKGEALPAPLPQRTQDRLNREAAYEQTKEEVQKWAPTMKRIREAEHLSFPLQAESTPKPSNAALTAQFKPSNELESAVDRLLKSAKMREEDIVKAEDMKMKELTTEEVAARRAELRQMRELMFRADIKAKRVAKIKSKTYRRIQKKERQKNQLGLDELDQLDPEAAEAERMKMEAERAKERATMRHKNTGKWAKAMLARGGDLDVDQRREILEQLNRGEMLRKKIHGTGPDDESEGSDGDDMGVEQIKAAAFDELTNLARGDSAEVPQQRGLFEMKFMKDAMAREQRRADELIDDFKSELRHLGNDPQEGTDDEADAAGPQAIGGRMSFRPGTVKPPFAGGSKPLVSAGSDISSVTLQSSETERPAQISSPVSNQTLRSEASNPWLVQGAGSSSKVSRKKNNVVLGKDSTSADKSKNAIRKQLKKTAEAKEMELDDATVDISMENVLRIVDAEGATPTLGGASKLKRKEPIDSNNTVDSAYQDSGDEGSEVEELMTSRKGNKAFEQKELVALAFAGDNVVEDFAAQKRREIEEDAPREVDTSLAGWGSWAGPGAKKAPPKRQFIKKISGVDPTKRADYGKTHVIISEKKDKKASKYLAKDLPYPYTSKAQFEKSLQVPLGTEWNTRVSFQKGTLPKVVKKMGVPINPLEKLF